MSQGDKSCHCGGTVIQDMSYGREIEGIFHTPEDCGTNVSRVRPSIIGYMAETTTGSMIMLPEDIMRTRPAPDYKYHRDSQTWYRPTATISKWSDSAMYEAEPMQAVRPTVTLLSMTLDPLGEIASCAKIYRGEVCRSLSEITDEERRSYFEDMKHTALDAAFEVVQFHFLFEGVDRSFTHQLIRQRMGAVYFQESLRFAVKSNMAEEILLPPSLIGTLSTDDFYAKCLMEKVEPEINMDDAQAMRIEWDRSIKDTANGYKALVDMGMPAEDARGIAPHATTTRVHYVTNLRAIKQHAGLRLCTQAQFIWREVWAGIIDSINQADTRAGGRVVMAAALTELFQPICYQEGKCQFEASFDRKCSIRERVTEFHDAGIPSNGWHSAGWNDHGKVLLPIRPAEWLLDPAAAR